jgi:hypothetical protein
MSPDRLLWIVCVLDLGSMIASHEQLDGSLAVRFLN